MDSPDSNQHERRSWKNPVELENLTHLRVPKAVPLDTAHLQDMYAALNALGSNIGPSLDRVCRDLHCIKAKLTFDLI